MTEARITTANVGTFVRAQDVRDKKSCFCPVCGYSVKGETAGRVKCPTCPKCNGNVQMTSFRKKHKSQSMNEAKVAPVKFYKKPIEAREWLEKKYKTEDIKFTAKPTGEQLFYKDLGGGSMAYAKPVAKLSPTGKLYLYESVIQCACGSCGYEASLLDNYCGSCGSQFEMLDKIDYSAEIKAFSKKQRAKFKKVLGEFKAGKLKHGTSGKLVPPDRRDIAFAIAFSVAKRAGMKAKAKS